MQNFQLMHNNGGPDPKAFSVQISRSEWRGEWRRLDTPECQATGRISMHKRRVLAKHYLPEAGTDGPSWLSFIGNMKDSLWSVDLFRCESTRLASHWVIVVMDVFTRRIIGFGVERADPCGAAICRMFNQIIAGKSPPRHLSSDHNPLFHFHRWRANLRILEVEEIKSIPLRTRVPSVRGTTDRDDSDEQFLDHVLIWNAVDLERKLEEFRILLQRKSRSPVA